MKNLKVCLLIIGSSMLLAPLSLMAQVEPPSPVCCPRGPEIAAPSQTAPPLITGQILVSSGMLEAQGITKREFAERLSMSIFAGKPVDLILFVKSTFNRPGRVDPEANQGLVAVEETRLYRVPLHSLRADQLDTFSQFGLTDGTVQFLVKFVKSESVESDDL